MSRIHVCHVITRLNPGGAQRNVLDLVARMDPEKVVSSLIAGPGGLLDEATKSLPDVSVHFVPDLVRPIRPALDLRAFHQCRSVIRGIRPDIVHTHGPKAGVIGRWAAFSCGVSVRLHTFHGLQLYPSQPRAERIATVVAERLTRSVTSQVVTMTEHDWAAAHRLGFVGVDRCTVIREGVDLAAFQAVSGSTASPSVRERKRRALKQRLGIDPGVPLVTMVGYLRAIKAPQDFVRLARLVADVSPRARFWLVGDGELRESVERLRDALGLRGTVELAGNRLDIPEIWGATDVGVLTSRSEGFPRTLTEAMASAVPVVTSDLPGIRELVQDSVSGFLVPAGRIGAMADRVIEMLGDPRKAARMGKHGMVAVRVMDVRTTVEQYEGLYRRLWGDELLRDPSLNWPSFSARRAGRWVRCAPGGMDRVRLEPPER